ncbi:MFS transporter [Penicillium lagena]|uniref:MFS transporter n=1 Tax=Penicillium lagena TaxID=94218 RepID=UPI002541FF9A|nr:MFS transporter [Penicillium lagena]KAJ5610895.1 MFS transporter [Penicillium lagena]
MEQPASPKREEASFPPNAPSHDARNWPQWKKNFVIFMVSFHSMSSTFMAAGIVPAASKFAHSYGVSLANASYLVSVQILLLGIAPIFWTVIADRYGRHYVLVFSVLASMVCNIGGARCTTYAGQMITRALTATVISPPIGIGSAVVVDLTTPDQRARKLGWWVLMTILGTPGGPFIMGFVVQHTEVQWIFWIYAIVNFLQALAYLLFSGETLYIPESEPDALEEQVSGLKKFVKELVPKRLNMRPITMLDFVSPFLLACKPRILVVALATAITFCYGNIIFVVEMPVTFGERFGLDSQQTGLQFISVIIGCLIGEQLGGPMSDYFMKVYRKRRGHVRPSDRLWLAYIGFLTIIAGLLIWGFQLQRAITWNVTPCVGIAIASFGNQIQSTILTAYAIDTCPDKSAEIGVFFNAIRLLYGFVRLLKP